MTPPPRPLYYRLRDRFPSANNTADIELAREGHEIVVVGRDATLLEEARSHLEIPNLHGRGLRMLIPHDKPAANRRLLELHAAKVVVFIRRQRVLDRRLTITPPK